MAHRRRVLLALVGGVLSACADGRKGASMDPVIQAVMERDNDALDRVLARGGNPNAQDDSGSSALQIAATSNQFRMANALVRAGADIWFADDFGTTPAVMAFEPRLQPGSAEAEACAVFVAHLRHAGYPWPPPRPRQVQAMRAQHQWPPATARGH